jgi:hypothetical protein
MSKRTLLVFSLILAIVSGCEPPDSPRLSGADYISKAMNEPSYIRAKQDLEQLKGRMKTWEQDFEKNEQDVNNCLAELKSILGQETSLLESLETEEQFNLYRDFLQFFQEADDQTKVYEFIQKLRATLPADKMETVMELYRQVKLNGLEFHKLQEQRETLILRGQELKRESEKGVRDAERREEMSMQRIRDIQDREAEMDRLKLWLMSH